MRDKRWGSHSRDLAHVQAEGVLKHQYDQGKSTGVLCSDLKLFFIFFYIAENTSLIGQVIRLALKSLLFLHAPTRALKTPRGSLAVSSTHLVLLR